MNLITSARGKEQEDTNYLPLDVHGLNASIEILGGDGNLKRPFCVKIRISNEKKEKWAGVIHVELEFKKNAPHFFLPAFMYGRNRGECPQNVPNEFPRLREYLNRPSSPDWMVRGDRLSHPVALVYDSGKIYGFSASPYFIYIGGKKQQWYPKVEGEFYQYAGFSCSLSRGTVGYTLGYENAPWLFVKSHDVRERAPLSSNCFELESGETIELTMDVYEFNAESKLAVNSVIREVYYRYHQSPRKAGGVRTTVADLAGAVFKDAWLPNEKSYAGQVFEDWDTGGYRYNEIISISWTNGLSVAVPMLTAALRLGDEAMRDQAMTCITNIIEQSRNPLTGLPYEAYHNGAWSNKGWWFDGMHTPGHSTYLIGQAMYYILKAYEYEMKIKNSKHEDWLIYVKEILFKINKTKNTDEEYPFILSEKTGAGIEYDAFSGAWCMAALAYYSFLTGDMEYLNGLRKSELHYYEAYIKHMECYGGPLDTDKATDSEGILAYIKAVRYLHALTGERACLEHMKDAFCYEFSFKFCYNSPVQIPPLSRIGWSSCGGSVTSIANPHIHPMSSNLVDELIYYADNTQDEYIRDRMMDTVRWGCQTYNTCDGEYDYGKKGWMSERFCHCEGLVTEKQKDGSPASTWFCLMPWASAAIIEGLTGEYWERTMLGIYRL
ncbi:hypothetical protein [Anaerocolumna jejuensis]|uniref:hypothetical protein n=1 Tax=Anaerocolumna jejuensis TaxID=259063 RepID=UPI003F7C634F